MLYRRIRAIFRKYKLPALTLISALGLASVFAVNLAGFLFLLPRPFWSLLDSAFVASYFMRFSILIALAFLASRYSVYIATSLLGLIVWLFALISLSMKKSGRRLIRIKGYKGAHDIARMLLMRRDNEVRYGKHAGHFEVVARNFYSSRFARAGIGMLGIQANLKGRMSARIERFGIPIQILAIVLVLSAVFTTLMGSIILAFIGIILFFSIPPRPIDVYFSKTYYVNGISFLTVLRYRIHKMVSVQKIVLVVLTLSLLSGILHHRSLVAEVGQIKFFGQVNLVGSLVMVASSGFVIHSSPIGYQFIPIEGTRIEELPSDSEATRRHTRIDVLQ